MKRGDLVSVALAGDFGKPRPALVIQSDRFEGTGTVTLLLISSELVEASSIRLTVEPTPENGLHKTSQVMIDKAMSVKRETLGPVFGRINDETMLQVTRALAVFFHVV
ncbi:type II toxin-antitoxin system PemK/MazF family toxin [Neorhizobium sp. BT27B]|uniref:type II toxin-antitoxin system PemK/MazF family toxin n=1 Tax=Neorhizobium sp. BT27B TaxID=3142625 RepID=UPI003D2C7FDE